MKVLITTGHSTSCITTIWSLMRQYGIEPAVPAQLETNDPIGFHQKLYAAKTIADADQTGQIQPGRMWLNQAETLLIQNLDNPLWGWADARSSRLLDFWAEVDESTFFILLYAPPEMAYAMAAGPEQEQADTSIDRLRSWRRKNGELLDFFSRNRDRCLLINSYSLIARPDRLADLLSERLGSSATLSSLPADSEIPYPVSALASLIARSKLNDPEAALLYEELETASDLPAPPDYIASELNRAWQENTRLLDAQAALAESLAEKALNQDKQAKLESQLDQALAGIKAAAAREESDLKLRAGLAAQLEETKVSLAQARKLAEEKEDENDLLLLQLLQVQDEIEVYYLKQQETETSLKQATQTLEARQEELSGLYKQLHSLEIEKQSFTQEQASLRKRMFELDAALDQARHQNETSRHRLETETASLRNQLQKITGELEQKLNKAENFKQSLQSEITELRERSASLDQKIAGSEMIIKNQNQEKQLLSLQLRQIQEELEDYYLRANESESTIEQQIRLLNNKEEEITGLQKQLLEMEKGKQAIERTTSELSSANSEMEQIISESRKNLNQKTEESKLLLLQLHQAQEELEIYFQKYQELQTANSEPIQAQSSIQFNTLTPPAPGAVMKTGLMRAYLEKHKSSRKLKNQIMLIQRSGLFDDQWYLKEYADVAKSGMEPIRHYLKFGAQEGRDPSLKFDTAYYLRSNPDLINSDINPLIHYISHGKEEGRKPHP